MDRRTIVAVALMLAVWWVFMIFQPDPPAALLETDAPAAGGETGDNTASDAPAEPGGAPVEAPSPSVVPDRVVSLEACGITSKVGSTGGYLHGATVDDFEGPYQVNAIYMYLWGLVTGGDAAWSPYGDDPGPQPLGTEKARYFGMGSGDYSVGAADVLIAQEADGAMVLTGQTRDGIQIRRTIRVRDGDPCVVEIEATWTNASSQDFTKPIWMQLHDDLPPNANAYEHAFRPYWSVDEGTWNSYSYPNTGGWMGLYKPLDAPDEIDGSVDWFGMSDGYFSVVAVPTGENKGRLVLTPIKTPEVREDANGEMAPLTLFGHHYVVDGLKAGASVTEGFTVYMGPNDTATLQKVDDTLYYLVDLGWFAFFGRPLLWLLKFFYSVIGNWGLSIIALTFVIKLAFFPLTQMAYVSSQKMSALQPQMKEIRAKYADNQQELNQKTMELFRENKVSPLGGCLPMLLQMPIWISLYRVLLTSVDLYHTEFLYLKDLSVADPYAILPLIVVGLMFGQQQLMPTSANMDPTQARMMKFMPVIIGFLFFTFPSGLVLYIFVNTSLTIVQQWFIKRRFGMAEAAASASGSAKS